MSNQSLQYFMHVEQKAVRLELAGSLGGEGVHSAYHAWQTAVPIFDSSLHHRIKGFSKFHSARTDFPAASKTRLAATAQHRSPRTFIMLP